MFVNDLIVLNAIDEKQHFRMSRSMKLSVSDDQPNGTISQSELFQNVEQHCVEGIFNKLDLWILQVDIQQIITLTNQCLVCVESNPLV